MDNFFLTSPQGSIYNLGSWIDLTDGVGPDFDAAAAFRSEYAEQPGGEGGRLAFESHGIRRMRFPLILPSQIDVRRSQLTLAARPGASLDLKLDGVATGEMVRFDVEAGRFQPVHYVREREIGRLRGVLELDVQPFGYWPTEIVLASVASVALPGSLTVNGAASVIGDVPGLARVALQPTAVSNYPVGTWPHDVAMWSLAGKPSFRAYVMPSAATSGNGSLMGDQFAPASQAMLDYWPGIGTDIWFRNTTEFTIPSAISPAYFGRYRIFGWARLTPSIGFPFRTFLNVKSDFVVDGAPPATAAPVATIPPAAAPDVGGILSAPSAAYTLVDFGEFTLPQQGSGVNQKLQFEIAVNPGSYAGATTTLAWGGWYFLPVDQSAGVLPRGMLASITTGSALGRLQVDGIRDEALLTLGAANLGTYNLIRGAGIENYRGVLPRLGPTVTQLDVLAQNRRFADGATSFPTHGGSMHAAVSLSYRPRFTFAKGI